MSEHEPLYQVLGNGGAEDQQFEDAVEAWVSRPEDASLFVYLVLVTTRGEDRTTVEEHRSMQRLLDLACE